MHTETLTYYDGEEPLKGFIAYDEESDTSRPAVLVVHAFRGQDDFARQKALQLAQFGYVGFAVDMYGEGKVTEDLEEAGELMAPFFIDRALMQRRILAAFNFLREQRRVDPQRMGAIGYCFGGLVVIELVRSGALLKGGVAFHAVLGDSLKGQSAQTVPASDDITASLLILHGHEDPFSPPEDVRLRQEDLTKAGVDWQMHIYGGVMHAFTNPMAQNKEEGILYSEKADRRSWRAMQNFFDNLF